MKYLPCSGLISRFVQRQKCSLDTKTVYLSLNPCNSLDCKNWILFLKSYPPFPNHSTIIIKLKMAIFILFCLFFWPNPIHTLWSVTYLCFMHSRYFSLQSWREKKKHNQNKLIWLHEPSFVTNLMAFIPRSA